MRDSSLIAEKLWNCWLSRGGKNRIIAGVGTEEEAEQLFIFLAAAHDLGKATPVFQAKMAYPSNPQLDEMIEEQLQAVGLPIRNQRVFKHGNRTPHALATQVLLEADGCNRNAAAILGAHHGKPPGISIPDERTINAYSFNYHLEAYGKDAWRSVQRELILYALNLAGLSSIDQIPTPDMAAQVLLCGLLIMTDWIVSNESFFPYISLDELTYIMDPFVRTKNAWYSLDLTYPWVANPVYDSNKLFQQRFSFDKPNNLQIAAAEIAVDIFQPGIVVIEAPMGQGKTEAALVCAEIFSGKTKNSGVFFALPTQATSDGIFPRLCKWIDKLDESGLYSIKLAHGKAQFNTDYQTLKGLEGSTNIGFDEDSSLIVHEWFEGQKKSMLADFVVGTIDQLLLAALKQKHVMLRHLGLIQKVVIIDECHAYDAYMSQYLYRVLNWLGNYGVPVIVLSATLPASKRQSVIDAYLNIDNHKRADIDLFGETINPISQKPPWIETRDYPLITYTDGNKVKQRNVSEEGISRQIQLEFLSEDALINKLEDLLSHGGCVGVIVNTVKRSQELARLLSSHFGKETVCLLHSLFLAPDRITKEQALIMELGPPNNQRKRPKKRIVVGTQVIEQSLDIDFDLLITDIAPMDLLLQRIGRLHRHVRERPEKLKQAQCLIMGCNGEEFEGGTKAIYGEYLLIRTKALLPKLLNIPQDIPVLVQGAYEEEISNPLIDPVKYENAKRAHDFRIMSKEERAQKFRISPIWPGRHSNLVGWLDSDISEQHGEATVRDSDESIEVILVREVGKGQLSFLSPEKGQVIIENEMPLNELGQALARQRIRLPRVLCSSWAIDNTIKELEEINIKRLFEWQQSPWLKGELVLILDRKNSAVLNGWHLTYCPDYGLIYEKEVIEDV